MPKKPSIKFIIEEFWNRGYVLYDNKFINAKTKMKYNCMKHPEEELEITYPFYLYEELRHDIDNGITLCRDCHDSRIKGSFHNTYGTHNNTKEQLEEFLGRKL